MYNRGTLYYYVSEKGVVKEFVYGEQPLFDWVRKKEDNIFPSREEAENSERSRLLKLIFSGEVPKDITSEVTNTIRANKYCGNCVFGYKGDSKEDLYCLLLFEEINAHNVCKKHILDFSGICKIEE